MEPPSPRAILVTADDATAFVASRRAARDTLSLSPAATAVLVQNSVPHTDSTSHFTSCSHVRAAVRSWQATEQLISFVAQRLPLAEADRQLLQHRLFIFGALAVRAFITVGKEGPWLIMDADGAWRQLDERTDVVAAVARRVLGDGARLTRVVAEPAAPALYKIARKLVLWSLAPQARWYVGPSSFRLAVEDSAQSSSARNALASISLGGKSAWIDLAKSAVRLIRGGPRRISVSALSNPNAKSRATYVEAFQDGVAILEDKLIAKVVAGVVEHLADAAWKSHCLSDDCHSIFRDLGARFCVFQNAETILMSPVLEGATRANVARIVINYNSLTNSHSPAPLAISKHLARQRYANALATHIMCWSPHGARLARAMISETSQRLIPVRLDSPVRSSDSNDRHFRILHADNYHEWFFSIPHIVHTSDEYLRHSKIFVDIVTAMDGFEIELRTKTKTECNPDVLRRLIPANPALQITGIETPFVQRLAAADLMVSFMSTTIEEALLMRVPVLLWGETARYKHLPARTTPPAPESRAAVYAVDDPSKLEEMLLAIRACHQGRPLTDDELEHLVWPASTASMSQAMAATLNS